MFRSIGLPLSADESLEPPWDGGLDATTGLPKLNMFGADGAEVGSGFGFFASAMKLPTTTWKEGRVTHLIPLAAPL